MPNRTFAARLEAWFHKLPIQDPIDRRMASLFQIMLVGFMSVMVLATVFNLFLNGGLWQLILLRGFAGIVVLGIPLLLLRRGNIRASVLLIIAFLLLLETYTVFFANLRSIAETLSFFTLAIILAGLLVSPRALLGVFLLSATAVIFGAFREQNASARTDAIVIALNFVLLNGLVCLFLHRFGVTLRYSLGEAREREKTLAEEVRGRQETEAELQITTARLEILHEMDRALLTARTHQEIAATALARIRKLIPCLRASVSLLDTKKREASFLAVDMDGSTIMPDTPISFAEFGQQTIDDLLLNKPSLIDDSLEGPNVTDLDRRLAKTGVRSWACLPLLFQGQLIGSLNLGRGAGETFTQEEIEIAYDIANQLAIAIHQTNLHHALQEELAERKRLISQLEANNEELERFTYTVSHDLRNPLVTIKGFLGMLEKDIHDNNRERIASDFQRISNAADKMQALLSDLLELSRIGRIANPPEEIDLTYLAQEAIETLDARIRSQNITVSVSMDLPTVYGDRLRLREVFENLIDNAAKYMGKQEDPLIEIGFLDGDEPAIFVRDNGIGIEPSYTSKIFGLFEQLNPTSEGTGIGLALIKRIIEVHGGKIWVESEGMGGGSTFYFTIPDGRKENG